MTDLERNIKIFRRTSSIDTIDWERISIKIGLHESFIHDYTDYLDWSAICKYQKLSIEFIIEHNDKVDWYYIVKKYDLPDVMIQYYYDQFNEATRLLLEKK